MAYPDSTPSSSYSDPIYDRLDTIAQAVRRRWYLYIMVLLLVIFFSLLIRRHLNNRPDSTSAAAFNRAFNGQDEAESLSRFKSLAEDDKADPYYRSRAWIEVTQSRLNQDDAPAARNAAEHAVSLAKEAKDAELMTIAKLSLAAADYQLQDFAKALEDYNDVGQSIGARSGALELEVTLGKARTLQSLGRLAEAASTLEPVLSRSDRSAQKQLDVARVLYWEIKRQLTQPKGATAPAAGPTPDHGAPPMTSPAPTGQPQPAAAPAPAPAPAPARAAPAAAPALAPAPVLAPAPATSK